MDITSYKDGFSNMIDIVSEYFNKDVTSIIEVYCLWEEEYIEDNPIERSQIKIWTVPGSIDCIFGIGSRYVVDEEGHRSYLCEVNRNILRFVIRGSSGTFRGRLKAIPPAI